MSGSPSSLRGKRVWTAALRRIAERRSVILGYHGVGQQAIADDPFRLLLSPALFEAQLELLLRAGFRFVTLAELAQRLNGGGSPPGLAVVTFDDGMKNNLITALPILARLGLPATVYVAVGFIGGHSPWLPGTGGEMLDEAEVDQLAQAGWEIGAHTMSHPDLSTMTYEACRAEMEQSRTALQRIAGTEVQTFAYPFGRYGPEAVAAARDCGFTAAVTIGSGKWTRHELTRAMVSRGDPFGLLMLKMVDRYEPLLATPPLRAARALSKRLRAQRLGSP
jgi:peptidoglycan/xylan/chitin deacetylase (PgdA/CDA1 family)